MSEKNDNNVGNTIESEDIVTIEDDDCQDRFHGSISKDNTGDYYDYKKGDRGTRCG